MLDLESLFKLSYGMCIVGSKKDGIYNGCIVNTVFQLTPEPPMLAVSVSKENLTSDYIKASKVFTVSILSVETPLPFIGAFGFRSGRDANKYEQVNFRKSQHGIPIILDNTIAFIEAEVTETVDIVTHNLFIAKIVACEVLDGEKEPLTYDYYRQIKHGRTPKRAATYHKTDVETKTKKGTEVMKKYECIACGYIYDPQIGDPDNGVEPGTAFESLPDDWTCPECGVGKDEFEAVEN